MPYINRTDREKIDRNMVIPTGVGAGGLTYILTHTCLSFLENIEEEVGPIRFTDYAVVLGALEATKLELYRRKIASYEDEKIKIHGDVY